MYCDIIACVNQNYNNRLVYIVMYSINYIEGEIVSILASSVVDRGFELWSGQTKDYKIGYFWLLR